MNNVSPHHSCAPSVHRKFHRLLLALSIGCAFGQISPAKEALPQRLKRADSFLGIHFDFHAGKDCTEIGKNTTPEMVSRIIDLVQPDYLQIDCKGHAGYSSYPTRVGNQAPGFVGDPLRVWRDVTAKRGVALYMHYSGVWDSRAIELHPDWGAMNPDGSVNHRATSFYGSYAEKLLIPQLRELAGDYGVDGAWVDGECWAAATDYSAAAVAAFTKATGIAAVPKGQGEPHWFEFLQFQREAFRQYLRGYLAALNESHPQFQICSNWAFTDHMAEPVSVPVAFLSGDYSPQNSVNSARLSGRFLARQGKPWDLMAWSFTTEPVREQKPSIQLQREAAVVVALGGGFQAYFQQKRDGSIHDEQMPVMAAVAKFCRARQALCHHSVAVPQVGLILSTADQYRRYDGLFPRDLAHIDGVLQTLLEARLSVEILGEHQLTGRMAEYPLLVLPECRHLDKAFRDELAGYVSRGGCLLLTGPAAADLFAVEMNSPLSSATVPNTPLVLEYNGAAGGFCSSAIAAAGPASVGFSGTLRSGTDVKPRAAAWTVAHGQGRFAVIACDVGRVLSHKRPELLRRLIQDLVRDLFPLPLVKVTGPGEVDLCVARKDGKLVINLVNTSGPHQSEAIIKAIPPAGPFTVSVRLEKQPAQVSLAPSGALLEFTWKDGSLTVCVPTVAVHEAVVIAP